MLYCVRMTISPLYRRHNKSIPKTNPRYEYYWSKTQYPIIRFFKCQKARYLDGKTTSLYYTDAEYLEIRDERIADDIREEYPNNMVRIYSTNNGAVDVVLCARMYFRLVSGGRLTTDNEIMCKEAFIHYLSEILIGMRFVTNEPMREIISNLIGIRVLQECEVDYIAFALIDASSWIHYYVI